jgi:small-conductance mechanosensitive channel
MPVSWLVYLLIPILLLADVLLVAALLLISALFTGYIVFNAFKDFIEGLINQLIKDILAELQGFIGAKPGNAAGYTSFALYVVKLVYSFVFGIYNLAQKAIMVLIILCAGLLGVGIVLSLVLVNSVLVYVVVAYVL